MFTAFRVAPLFLLSISPMALAGAPLRAGFAEVDITPPPGLEMSGFGPYLKRVATSVHDPLQAHAAVLELDGERIAIVGCDLLTIDPTSVARVRAEVGQRTGIPGSHILVSTTHTHSGPAVVKLVGWGERDPQYINSLPGRLTEAIILASQHLQPVTLFYADIPVDKLAENREYKNGPVDKSMRVLRFVHDGNLLGFIVNYSVHNVIFSENMHENTKDMTGVALAKVEKEHPGSVGIYLQGSCGDQNPYKFANHLPPDQCVRMLEELSTRFAGYVNKALSTGEEIKVTRLSSRNEKIRLPLLESDRPLLVHELLTSRNLLKQPGLPEDAARTLRFEENSAEAVLEHSQGADPEHVVSEIQALQIENIVIVAHPGEMFISLGEQIVNMLPNLHVLVTGYSNDFLGYIPTPDRYSVAEDHYSYPAYFVPRMRGTFSFRPDIGDTLVEDLVRLASDLTAAEALGATR